MSRYRAHSAGGSSRARSAGSENRVLREQISYLQQQLMFSKAETQKTTDQLNCLISLIKRAWTGDRTASVHVANIAGVAPPDIQPELSADMGVSIVAKPKSRAINSWAVLTIGVLNREYKLEEREQADKQRRHLQRRQDYLEEQLLYNRDIQAQLQPRQTRPISAYRHNGTTFSTVPREGHSNSSTDRFNENYTDLPRQPPHRPSHNTCGHQHISVPEKICVDKPPSAATQSGKSLYQRPRELQRDVFLTLGDLVIEPSTATSKINKTTDLTMDGLYRLPSSCNIEVSNGCHGDGGTEEKDDDRMYIAYDDPQRYTKCMVYDVEGAVGTEALTRRCRPLSAQLRQADSHRARPKSAVHVKPERPLKYETTRPISAQVSRNRTKDPKLSNARSSHWGNKPKQFVTLQDTTSYTSPGGDIGGQEAARNVSQGESCDGSLEHGGDCGVAPLTGVFEDLDITELMKVDVTRPECIKQFDNDLRAMDSMEQDFKQRAVDLQKKLGITADGMLYPGQ